MRAIQPGNLIWIQSCGSASYTFPEVNGTIQWRDEFYDYRVGKTIGLFRKENGKLLMNRTGEFREVNKSCVQGMILRSDMPSSSASSNITANWFLLLLLVIKVLLL